MDEEGKMNRILDLYMKRGNEILQQLEDKHGDDRDRARRDLARSRLSMVHAYRVVIQIATSVKTGLAEFSLGDFESKSLLRLG
jgi:hypothetical protein